MRDRLPPEIIVEDLLAGGLRFRLPPRQLGALRWVGIFMLTMGLPFVGGGLYWIISALTTGPGVAGGVSALFGLPFVVAGAVEVALGMALTRGQCDIEALRHELVVKERAGLFRWTRRWRLEHLDVLQVAHLPIKVNNEPLRQGPLARLGGILFQNDLDGEKPELMVVGYPRDWLEPLAGELAAWATRQEGRPIRAEQVAVAQLSGKLGQLARQATAQNRLHTADIWEQPAGSRVVVEEFPNGLTLSVPPAGLWKGSHGLFFFSLVWLAIVSLISLGGAFAIAQADWEGITFGILFLSIFWIVGLLMLLSAWNMGRRKAALAVAGDTLMVLQTGIWGNKSREWQRDEVTGISLGRSGLEVNNRPVLELQIHCDRGKFGLLAGRDEKELGWMATRLRQALSLEEADTTGSLSAAPP